VKLAFALCLMLFAAPVVDRPEQTDVEEHLGVEVPKDLRFVDAQGRSVRLGDLVSGETPTLLVLAYERCPSLCGFVLNGVATRFKALGWQPGREVRPLTVSFDATETPEAARRKQTVALERAGAANLPHDWPFLVGDDAAIKELTDRLGFSWWKDPATGELVHPAVVVVLTPDGRVSRYLYGLEPEPRDLELAVLEASQGKQTSTLDRVLLRCWRWDPAGHRYELAVMTFVRAGVLLVALALGLLLLRLWQRERSS
jgi:protein SCO1/2